MNHAPWLGRIVIAVISVTGVACARTSDEPLTAWLRCDVRDDAPPREAGHFLVRFDIFAGRAFVHGKDYVIEHGVTRADGLLHLRRSDDTSSPDSMTIDQRGNVSGRNQVKGHGEAVVTTFSGVCRARGAYQQAAAHPRR